MLKNYLKIAFRNITRHKAYSGINILGLAIGIAACLLILQYVAFELSYENFHSRKDRIYRVRQDRFDNGKLSTQWAAGAYAVGNSFKDAIPEIEDFVKVVPRGEFVTNVDNKVFKIKESFFASKSFFNIFSYPLVEGNANTALAEPFTAVISETTARNLYGTTNIIGKTLNLNRKQNVKITGVFKDMPSNTQLKPNLLISYVTFRNLELKDGSNDPDKAWGW